MIKVQIIVIVSISFNGFDLNKCLHSTNNNIQIDLISPYLDFKYNIEDLI